MFSQSVCTHVKLTSLPQPVRGMPAPFLLRLGTTPRIGTSGPSGSFIIHEGSGRTRLPPQHTPSRGNQGNTSMINSYLLHLADYVRRHLVPGPVMLGVLTWCREFNWTDCPKSPLLVAAVFFWGIHNIPLTCDAVIPVCGNFWQAFVPKWFHDVWVWFTYSQVSFVSALAAE